MDKTIKARKQVYDILKQKIEQQKLRERKERELEELKANNKIEK